MLRLNRYYADMASRRADCDLWLVLGDPVCARNYIADFEWNCPPEWRPDKVVLDSGRVIYFKRMSDEDAVAAAMAILRDVQIPQEMRDKQILEELGEVH